MYINACPASVTSVTQKTPTTVVRVKITADRQDWHYYCKHLYKLLALVDSETLLKMSSFAGSFLLKN